MIEKYKKIATDLTSQIKKSNNILIIASKRVDPDCLGTTVALKWWIKEKFKKDSKAVLFSNPLDLLKDFPRVDEIEFTYENNVEWKDYDLYIFVDGGAWTQFMSSNYRKILGKLDMKKVYCIDHHNPQTIEEEIPERMLRINECCTAKIVYDYFIEPSKLKPDEQIATAMYKALIDDTNRFMHGIYEDTFDFAQQLRDIGADHEWSVNYSMTMEEVEWMIWAMENTKFIPEIQSSILTITQQKEDEAKELFGEKWKIGRIKDFYKAAVLRKVQGYNYGLIFSIDKSGIGVQATWRTRNYGDNISMEEVLTKLGLAAGGHFGAGGGFSTDVSIDEIEELFIEEMKRRIGGL